MMAIGHTWKMEAFMASYVDRLLKLVKYSGPAMQAESEMKR
jgi:hypothetical protein